MANNLEQQKEMNELLKQQSKFFEAQNKNLKVQSALMIQLVSALKGISFKDAIEETRQLNELLNETSSLGTEAGTNTSNAMREAAGSAEEALDKFERLHPVMGGLLTGMAKLNVQALAGQGIMRGFNFSIDMFRNITSGVAGLASSIFQIGVAILSLPFRMWDAFLNLQTSGGGEWRLALENVRKEFGDLTKFAAADMLQMERNLNGVIAETGLSTYRIFGNRAEQLNTLREYATKLGAAFNVLSKSIASSASETERFAAYMKGLGMSDAGIKGVGMRAVALGTTVNEIGREITTFAFQVGESFGINGRQISADIGEMIGDVANFGNITVKEMTQAAVFTRKLGIEFKAILGTIEAFDNFDKAAEGAAQLSQAFGMNIDAMQMIREEDPAARFETLRRAFFATGRSIESMTRQERALLATQTGLSAEAVKLGFSAKSQAMSYDQVQKAADGASKKQLTQEEAMQKLANSIDRLIKSGSQLQGGFIQHFLQGFERGIRRSKEFREMFWAIRRALRDTFWAGAQVGRMFVDMFPGVKQFFGGIAGIFNRNRFREMLSNIKQTFRQFFSDITKDPQQGVQKFLDSLKDNFLNWFSNRSPQGRQVLEGLTTFFKAFIGIVTQLGRIAIQGLIDGAKALVRYIKNPTDLGIESAADGFMGYIIEIFGPLWSMLVEMLPQLGDALWELLTASLEFAWQKLQPYWEEYGGYIIWGMIAWFTLPAVIGAFAAAISGFFIKAIGIGLTNVVTGGAVARQAGGLMNAIFGINRAAAAAPPTPANPPVPAKGFMERLGEALKSIEELNIDFSKARKNAFGIASVIVFGIIPIATAIGGFALAIQQLGITASSIALSALIIAESAAIVVAVGYMAKALGAVRSVRVEKNLASVGLFIVALTAFFSIAFAGLMLVIKEVPITNEDIQKLDDLVDIMVVLFGTLGALALASALLGRNAQQAAGGIRTIGVFIGGISIIMAAVAGIFAWITSDMTPERMAGLSSILDSVSQFMYNSIPLSIAAVTLGALILSGGPAALITGGVLAVGIGALGAIVSATLEAAREIVNAANEFSVDEGTESKINVILNTLNALASFTNGFIGVLSLAKDPGDIEGKGGILTETLTQINTFIDDFFRNTTNLIQQIQNFAAGINVQQIPAIEAVAGVISSVAEFATGIVGAFDGIRSKFSIGLGGIEISDSAKDLNNILDAAGTTLELAGNYIPQFIHLALSAAARMNRESTTPEQLNAIGGVISGFMGAIVNLVKALSGSEIIGLSGNEGGRLTNLRKFIVNVSDGLLGGEGGGVIGRSIGGILGHLSEFSSTVTAEDVKKIEPITKFIGPLFETIGGISKAVSSLGGSALSGAASGTTIDAAAITNLSTMFTTIFDALKDFLPELISTLNTTLSGVNATNLGAKAKALRPVFELITTVQTAISQFYWTARNAGGGMANWTTKEGGGIAAGLGTLRSLFRENNSGGSFFEILRDVINGIKRNLTPETLGGIEGINVKNVNKLKTIMEAIKSVSESFDSIKSTFTSIPTGGGASTVMTTSQVEGLFVPLAGLIYALTDKRYQPETRGANKTFKEWLDQFGGARLNVDTLKTLSSTLETLSSIAASVGTLKTRTASLGTETNISELIDPTVRAILALTETEYNGRTLPQILREYSGERFSSRAMTAAARSMTALNPVITELSSLKRSIIENDLTDSAWITSFFNGISLMAQEVNRVNADFAILAETPRTLVATLDTLASTLGRTINYSISTERIQYTINLSVNVDAKEFANTLIEANANIATAG